jgi:hypothetical protein
MANQRISLGINTLPPPPDGGYSPLLRGESLGNGAQKRNKM